MIDDEKINNICKNKLHIAIKREMTLVTSICEFMKTFIMLESNENAYGGEIDWSMEKLWNEDVLDDGETKNPYGYLGLIETIYNNYIPRKPEIMVDATIKFTEDFLNLFDDGNGNGNMGKMMYMWYKSYKYYFCIIIKELHMLIEEQLYRQINDDKVFYEFVKSFDTTMGNIFNDMM